MAAVAYVLIEATPGTGSDIVRAIQELPQTLKAERVTGPYDVIAIVSVEKQEMLREFIRTQIHGVEGIVRTTSCITEDFDS